MVKYLFGGSISTSIAKSMPHKRAREEDVDQSSKARLVKVAEVKHGARAVVGEVSGIHVPESADFSVYQKGKAGPYMIHGESDKMDYSGAQDETASQYCLALYNKDQNCVQLVPAPLVSLKSVVKSKISYNGPRIRQDSEQIQNSAHRSALGEAFGTRKAKQAIRNQRKNKIEADQLADLESAIVDTVMDSTASLPSQQVRNEGGDAERPIPPHNLETDDPHEVYPIVDGLMSQAEWKAISGRVQDILGESDPDTRFALLPKTDSTYLRSRLDATLSEGIPAEKEDRVKLIYFAALLLGLYKNKKVSNRTKLAEKLGSAPSDYLLMQLINNFSTNKAGSVGRHKDRAFIVDPAHETKLLCYLLATVLHLENFTCNVQMFVNELSVKASRISDLFRTLGCSVKPMSATRLKKLGLTDPTIKEATLRVPLTLPQMTRRIKSKN